jgi:hypothetical protein
MKRGKMHKNNLRKISLYFFLIIITLLFNLSFIFANNITYEQGIHLIRPYSSYLSNTQTHPIYLSLEDITFISCLEDEDISITNSILCIDNNNFEDLESFRWTIDNNCYISSFNFESFDCNNAKLQSEYSIDDEVYRMYKDIKVDKYSKVLDKILDSQYSDGGWRTIIDTTYGVWALSHFKKIFEYEIENGINWLKLKRNPVLKCWPTGNCNVPLTMEILYILTQSGFDEARRTVNDAKNWIENLQNYYLQGDEWTLEVTAKTDDLQFILIALEDKVFDSNFTLDEDETKVYSFKAFFDENLYVISYDNFQAKLYNQYGEELFIYHGTNLSYPIGGACWSNYKKGEPCNTLATAYAVQLNLHEPNEREAKRWMFTRLNYSNSVGIYYGNEDNIIETALFLEGMHNLTRYQSLDGSISDFVPYMLKYDYLNDENRYQRYVQEITNWLLFRQNNEGSWGDQSQTITYKSLYTAMSTIALTNSGLNFTSEPIEDAKQWLSSNEDSLEVNDTRALGSAFFVLKDNARPILVFKPKIIELQKSETEVEIYNPTAFNLNSLDYRLSENLEDFINVEKRDVISAYSYRKIKIKKINSDVRDAYGFLEIYNYDELIGKVPIIIAEYPSINVTVKNDENIIFGKNGNVPLDIKKSNHEFMCSMTWDSDELMNSNSVKINSNSISLPINFKNPITKQDLYTGILTCTSRGHKYILPLSVFINRFSSVPFEVFDSQFTVSSAGEDISFAVKNNLDRDLNLQVSLTSYSDYFQIINPALFNPNQNKNLTLKNLIPSDINHSENFNIELESLGHKVVVPVYVEVVPDFSSKNLGLLLPIILGFILLIVIVGTFLGYKNKEKVKKLFFKTNAGNIKQEIEENLTQMGELREKEKINAIVNMVKILKFQEKSDPDIKSRLLENFSKEEIMKSLNQANLIVKGFEEGEEESETK